MGLISGVKKVTTHKDIAADDQFYQVIDFWHLLYQGIQYGLFSANSIPDWFKDSYYTVSGGEQTRRRNSLNMPKLVAEEMAKLVFNERCKINISDETLSDNIEDVFKKNRFYKQFQRYLEYGFALGGVAIKVFGDKSGVKISYVTADCFIPISHSAKEIREGVFVNQIRKGKHWYTLLEWHTWNGPEYIVKNELYKSETQAELGVKISLAEMYPDLKEEVKIKHLTRPLFVYIKPNVANNFDTQSPLGISIYANAVDTIKAMDVAFDSFMREFKLGKKRIMVPHTAVKTVIDTDGNPRRYFDANDEVYQALGLDEMGENSKIQDISVEIRVEEHIAAINALLDILSMQVGFSAGTFTFDGQGVKTATEVVSENSKTFRTKNSHEIQVEEGLQELVITICEVAALYDIFKTPKEYEVAIDFDDSIAEDRNSNADYYLKLKNGGVLSAITTLMRILGYTEEQAKEELAKIVEERKTMTPDIDNIFGRE